MQNSQRLSIIYQGNGVLWDHDYFAFTVTVHLLVTPPSLVLMTAVTGETPQTDPVASTVATLEFDDVQETFFNPFEIYSENKENI